MAACFFYCLPPKALLFFWMLYLWELALAEGFSAVLLELPGISAWIPSCQGVEGGCAGWGREGVTINSLYCGSTVGPWPLSTVHIAKRQSLSYRFCIRLACGYTKETGAGAQRNGQLIQASMSHFFANWFFGCSHCQ